MLYYRSGNSLLGVQVQTEAGFIKQSQPEVLFTKPGVAHISDIHPDGSRFLALMQATSGLVEIHIVLNWFEELKRISQ